jgi:adenosylmethionine-8-amino-7-oxononanoate aminotransferase
VAERIAALGRLQEERLEDLRRDPRISVPRRIGTVTALDLKVADPGYLSSGSGRGLGPELAQFFREKDLLLRPLGNTIYVLPPYCVTAAELDSVYDAIRQAAEKFV